ncbi:MAG: hypothetical protein IJH34_16280 [Romboutsia sp.]|nr:hypothetical protein [Romboutsia sp.]
MERFMLCIAIFSAILVFYAWIRTVVFVYSNAKMNNFNYLLWTLFTIICPCFGGFIIYAVVRKTSEVSKPEEIEIRKVVNTIVSVIIVVIAIIVVTG